MWEKWIRIKPSKTDKSKVRKQAVVAELPLLPELGDVLSFAPSGKADVPANILGGAVNAASTQTTAMKPPDSVALGHLIHNDRSTPMHAAGLPVDGYRFILVNPPAVRLARSRHHGP